MTVASAEDLEEQVSAGAVDGHIAQFVDLCGAPHKSTYGETSVM
jgi:hypothetical protein